MYMLAMVSSGSSVSIFIILGNLMIPGVTPCFPQFVKITGLAKNYGKLINVNMSCKWTLRKRSMNVNNILNFIARLLRGDVQKKKKRPRWRWKASGKVALTSTEN
jgi:hypothetical protein